MSQAEEWLGLECLEAFADEIDNRLQQAESQLRLLGRVCEMNESSKDDVALGDISFEAILECNTKLEQDLIQYSGQLHYWENLVLSITQKFEVERTIAQLNRLSVVNANIVLLSKNFLKCQDSSSDVVESIIENLKRS